MATKIVENQSTMHIESWHLLADNGHEKMVDERWPTTVTKNGRQSKPTTNTKNDRQKLGRLTLVLKFYSSKSILKGYQTNGFFFNHLKMQFKYTLQ